MRNDRVERENREGERQREETNVCFHKMLSLSFLKPWFLFLQILWATVQSPSFCIWASWSWHTDQDSLGYDFAELTSREANSEQAKKKTRSAQKIWQNVKGLTWPCGITNDTIKMTQEGNQTRRWKMEWREGVLPDRTDNFCNTLPRLLKEDGKESDP